MNAVVKIFCVHTEPNFSLPWQRQRQYQSTSSGFAVQGNQKERWLLTNAHSVEYYTQASTLRPESLESNLESSNHDTSSQKAICPDPSLQMCSLKCSGAATTATSLHACFWMVSLGKIIAGYLFLCAG
jgi:hypothetical protein